MESFDVEQFYYWDFIEKYYPDYYSRNDILLSDILSRKMNGQQLDEKDEVMIKNLDIKHELITFDKLLLSEALENYFSNYL